MDSEQRAKFWLGKLTKLNPNQARPTSACRGKAVVSPTLNFKPETLNRGFTAEHGPEMIRLNSFAGRHLQFDPAAKLRPSAAFIRRHRRQYQVNREILAQ